MEIFKNWKSYWHLVVTWKESFFKKWIKRQLLCLFSGKIITWAAAAAATAADDENVEAAAASMYGAVDEAAAAAAWAG